jgi:hypothetical protein
MKTPAGKECDYFFGDYYRGRNREECRLIGNQSPPNHWTPDLCSTCPVPGILLANSCQHMHLKARVGRKFLGLKRYVEISAYCDKTNRDVTEPHIGCGECHPLPTLFIDQD